MRVRVRLVSLLREAVGSRELELELEDGATLGDLLEALYGRFPRLREIVEGLEKRGLNVLFMVNGSTAALGERLRDGDVVTILPPASGGA